MPEVDGGLERDVEMGIEERDTEAIRHSVEVEVESEEEGEERNDQDILR